ncbi:acyltransferase [Pseudoclavibacter alba]|uniref:acyltransferase family protein n=1 Tax=Pseudoclavibacter albus TaxID=272241 RepID=UPI0019D1DAF1|nr:acyltransferase family protein [Pseudoclavibacter alba]MBN6778297.1 acyltransferase [Pseudoclavibacter alba]
MQLSPSLREGATPRADSPAKPEEKAAATTRFVPEIQGLRTIALLLVATFHIWIGRVSGGVDIFLLISAYLLTRSLTTSAEQGKLTRPITFILKKFTRLLPAAVLTIALTLLAGFLILDSRFWNTMMAQGLAALTYTMNFWLQGAQVDYYAQSRSDASLFQHFWSLAIQGQVFLLWPVLHLAAEVAAKVTKIRVRWILIAGFSLVFLGSFLYALKLTAINQPYAYFSTPARLWEFAAGSLLALVVPYLRIPRRVGTVLIWLGIAGAVSCGFVLPVQSSFPGVATLWPLISAALVIAPADASSRAASDRPWLLGHPILQKIGGYTYALYLTHWPVLILHTAVTRIERPDPLRGLLLLAVSVVAAVIITELADRPVAALAKADRPFRPSWLPQIGWRRLAALAACCALGFGAIGSSHSYYQSFREGEFAAVTNAPLHEMGPQAPDDARFGEPIPGRLIMSEQLFTGPSTPCTDDVAGFVPLGMCFTWGDTESADREIYIIGNSHSVTYSSMFMEIAEQQPNWLVRTQAYPGCTFLEVDTESACDDVFTGSAQYIQHAQPDLVVVLGSFSTPAGPDQLFTGDNPHLADWIRTIEDTTTSEVVTLRDVPRFDENMFECASEHGYDSPECVKPTSVDAPELEPYIAELEGAGGTWIDFNEAICRYGECRPSNGGLVTYYDDNHITDVFSRSLAQHLSAVLSRDVHWWPQAAWPAL